MPELLKGKVAIVTGAGGAIGRAVAVDLARQGARVVVNDLGAALDGAGRDSGPAAATVEMIRAAGGKAVANTDSVAEWASAQKVVECALDHFGRVDVLVNNAGNLRYVTFQDSTPEDFDSLMRVHLYGSYYMARATAPHFQKQQSGVYVHMISSTALIGMSGNACYVTAKMGVVGMSRAIALDMASYNVRSNCVAPAATSRMSPKRKDEALEAHYKAHVRAEQVAPLVTYLASDAAKNVTGQIMGVRGNEFYLYNQSRPIRIEYRDGWTAEDVIDYLHPLWQDSLTPLEETYQVFNWLPR